MATHRNFIQEITPQPMKDRLEVLKSQRTDIQTLSFMLGPDKFLEWAHSIGVTQDEELRALAPAIAPLRLRQVTASHSESLFLWTGLVDILNFIGHYHRFATQKETVRVLDFGCGGGRLTRFLAQAPGYQVFGSDVNPDHVSWCQSNLDAITTRRNDVTPPLDFDGGLMDFIYALSVFSHLREAPMGDWLRELARVAARDGVLLLTTHGETAVNLIVQSKPHQEMFKLTPEEASDILARMRSKGFVHITYDEGTRSLAKAGDDYGNAFISERYVRDTWPSFGFRLLEYIPGGMRGFQDIVLLQKL